VEREKTLKESRVKCREKKISNRMERGGQADRQTDR
jgi:hypothetical protein